MQRSLQLKDTVVSINRVTKVVKGGKNLSFSALVVVGDESGHVGYGNGKAKEVPQAIRKAIEAAKKNLIKVPLTNNTIPHQIMGLFGAGRVLLKPAVEGTGIIAGGAVRAVMQAAGVSEHSDEIDWNVESAQRYQGDVRGTSQSERSAGSGAASGETAGRDYGVTVMAAKEQSRCRQKIKIQYYRSAIGFNVNQKLIVKGPGFQKTECDT